MKQLPSLLISAPQVLQSCLNYPVLQNTRLICFSLFLEKSSKIYHLGLLCALFHCKLNSITLRVRLYFFFFSMNRPDLKLFPVPQYLSYWSKEVSNRHLQMCFYLPFLNYCYLWMWENVFLCQNGNGRHKWQSLFLKIWDCTKLSVLKMTLWHSLSLRWCLSFLTPAVSDSWNGSRR